MIQKTTGIQGIDLIKTMEGIILRNNMAVVYRCPAGYVTIGWGCRYDLLNNPVTLRTPSISIADAEIWLKHSLLTGEQAVNRLVKVAINQNQFDALVSFVMNLGAANFATSTLLKLLNSGDHRGASNQFQFWNKARIKGILQPLPGLTIRRLMEKTLFNKTQEIL